MLKCRIIDDKCRLIPHANAAADEVRRPEFFRRGGVARAVALPEELWIDQPRWQSLKPMEKLADMPVNHLEGILNYRWTKVKLGVVEAVNGNIKASLRGGRGYRNLNYLPLTAQRLAARRIEYATFQKAA